MKLLPSLLSVILFVSTVVGGFSPALRANAVGPKKSSDLALMNLGRLYFEKGDLHKAYQTYELVPQSSDFWLEAVEEKAHVMGRQKEYAKALSLLQTVMSPAFDGMIGPEPYFVAALTHLKICDYSSIFKISQQFKERFKKRIQSLEEIKSGGTNKAVEEMLKRLSPKPLSFETLGILAKELPRGLPRDRFVLSQGTKPRTVGRDAALKNHVRQLARQELKEIEDIVNKLQVLEAEVIQRIHLAQNAESDRPRQGSIARGSSVMTFPYTGEVWLDELNNYAVKVETCPQSASKKNGRRASL